METRALPANEEEIREEDIMGEVKFEIDKEAFKRPIKCCNKKTVLANKRLSYKDMDFSYSAWQCPKCKKEYLDFEQAKRLERFWTVRKIMEDRSISIERSMNFDGKTYFFRFPKELTKGWHKSDVVDIKLITPGNNAFLIEIKHAHK